MGLPVDGVDGWNPLHEVTPVWTGLFLCLVIIGHRGDSPYGEVGSLLGKSCRGRGSRESEKYIIYQYLVSDREVGTSHAISIKYYKFSSGGKEMKKLFSMFVAVAFALSIVGFAFAADNAAKPAVPAAEKKEADTKAAAEKKETDKKATSEKKEADKKAAPATPATPAAPAEKK